jgi:hypothetical protein
MNTQLPTQNEDKLANALAGKNDFSIKAIIGEAWALTKGFKLSYWAASLLYLLSIGGLGCVGVAIYLLAMHFIPEGTSGAALFSSGVFWLATLCGVILFIFTILLSLCLYAGIWMLSIKRATNRPFYAIMIFDYFASKWKLLGIFLWCLLLNTLLNLIFPDLSETLPTDYLNVFLGILGVIGSVFISLSYLFSEPLVAEKNLSAWRALETSRRVVWKKLFKLIFTLLIVLSISAAPGLLIALLWIMIHPIFGVLGVVYFWLLPFAVLATGVLYRDVFGISPIDHPIS